MADKYTIEPHGPAGQYALYFGRDKDHHGLRLCNLSDFDMNAPETIRLISDSLNHMTDWGEEPEPDHCPSCHGCGEYQTAKGWHPCPACKGKGTV